eukprot:3165357-Rhodomonas_salina.1
MQADVAWSAVHWQGVTAEWAPSRRGEPPASPSAASPLPKRRAALAGALSRAEPQARVLKLSPVPGRSASALSLSLPKRTRISLVTQ